jgi:hypothetical protein
MIRPIWLRSAAGVLGGHPKAGKTWMGLDMAVSVASGTACLRRFPVEDPGPALVYLAEDDEPLVRRRLESICASRAISIDSLALHVITEPVLRLDQEEDQHRLVDAVERLRPRLLVLDPLIRLHRLDDNSASEISGLLGYFREVQRRFDCAIVIVHHVSKKARAMPGQALRGPHRPPRLRHVERIPRSCRWRSPGAAARASCGARSGRDLAAARRRRRSSRPSRGRWRRGSPEGRSPGRPDRGRATRAS